MKKGFTLLELLVVIAIIAILASVGLGSYTRSQRKARDARRRSDLKQIQNALEQYYSINGSYPNSEDAVADYFSDGHYPQGPQGEDYTPVGGWSGVSTSYTICVELEAEAGNCDNENGTSCPESCPNNDACSYFCIWSLQ